MIINSMIIIDVNKEEAREFVFSDSINLIVSQDNTQGKSSLIKSMYYALGYEIKTFPSDWDIKNICIQLQCDIDGDIYFISRKNTVFHPKKYPDQYKKVITRQMHRLDVILVYVD